MSKLRQLQPGQAAETRTWSSMSEHAQKSLLAQMPPDVQARVRNGETIAETEIEALMRQHYDVAHRLILWKVGDDGTPIKMRTTLFDSVQMARKTMAKQIGNHVLDWTDLEIMSMGMPAPRGFRWALSHERVSV